MKNFTQLHKNLIEKRRLSKQLLLITVLCFAFSVKAQVRLVKDIVPGTAGSNPGSFYEYENDLFFSGGASNSGFNGRLIFRSDGTDAGTTHLSFNPFGTLVPIRGSKGIGSNPLQISAQFYVYNNDLYFDAFHDQIYQNGTRVFKLPSGGSTQAEVIHSFYGGGTTFNATRLFEAVLFNGKLISGYYTAYNGWDAYAIDLVNQANSTIIDVNPGAQHSSARYFTEFNNKVYFSASESTNGREVWETDGTVAGTQLFVNINFGFGNSDPDQYIVLGSKMIFAATNDVTGRELFTTDGTVAGTTILTNINPSGGNANPSNMTKIGSDIYLSMDNGTDGQELWKSDGTTGGTIQLKNINPAGDSNPANFIQFGSNVYFTATDGTNGVELYVTNGSPNVAVLAKDINPSGDSNPSDFVVYNGRLYFTAFDGVERELWSANGNSNGTVKIDILPGTNSSSPSDLFVYNNELYFNAYSPATGIEPHAYSDAVLSVNDFNLFENKISLFPNPTNNYFEIKSKETLIKVEIYSLQGQVVKGFTPQNQYDISELSSGIYFAKILANNMEITKRIIKE